MRARAATLAACVLVAGCGGSDERASSTPTPTPTPTAAPTTAPGAAPTAFAPSAPEPPENPENPEAQPGGAGDEQPIAQPVRLTIDGKGITPALVKVSTFLPVELVVRNATSREQIVTVLGARPKRAVSVGAGQTGRLRYDGLRRGRYTIEGHGAGRATLVASLDEP